MFPSAYHLLLQGGSLDSLSFSLWYDRFEPRDGIADNRILGSAALDEYAYLDSIMVMLIDISDDPHTEVDEASFIDMDHEWMVQLLEEGCAQAYSVFAPGDIERLLTLHLAVFHRDFSDLPGIRSRRQARLKGIDRLLAYMGVLDPSSVSWPAASQRR